VPEIAMSVRLLDARSGKLLASFEEVARGDDGEKIFGLGRVHSLGKLAEGSMERLVDRIDEALERTLAAAD